MENQRKISKSKQKHKRFVINTKSAPSAIGPYNQAVLINNTLYISGQLGLDPSTMELVEGGVVEEAIQVSLEYSDPNLNSQILNNFVSLTWTNWKFLVSYIYIIDQNGYISLKIETISEP